MNSEFLSAEFENLPYVINKRKELKEQFENIKFAKDRLAEQPLSAEDMYNQIERSLERSPIKEKTSLQKGKSIKDVFPFPDESPSEKQYPVLERIPVDESRDIEIRAKPDTLGKFEIAAVKKEVEMRPKPSWYGDDSPPPIPKIVKKDIAKLDLYDTGQVSFVKSSFQGAKEGALERVMMEATKRNMAPHSQNLLGPGSNMVGRIKKEFDATSKEKYLEKIKNFLKTGKTGKVWSMLAPVAKVGGAISALTAPSADAMAADLLIPGGLESLGSADESAIVDKKYQQYIKKMQNRRKYPKTGGM